MMGGELGCEAEVLGQLTRSWGESSRSVGIIGTGHPGEGLGGMGGWAEKEHESIQLSDPDP